MGSSQQLTEPTDVYKAGRDYKKISECFQLAVFTVQNVIKKWQLRGTVEVKTRSERTRKLSAKTARLLGRKTKQNPNMTMKDLQEGLADTRVMVLLACAYEVKI